MKPAVGHFGYFTLLAAWALPAWTAPAKSWRYGSFPLP